MNIKKSIVKILPKSIYYKVRLKQYNKNAKKSEKDIKQDISNRYFKRLGRNIDWNNPKTHTEKVNIEKLKENEIKTRLSDKYEVRVWVKNKIGEKYLIPLLGVYNSFDEIDFDILPDKFVMKCNHDSASVSFCNKKELNLKQLKHKYDFHMAVDYSLVSYEKHYHNIKHKIIIEPMLEDAVEDYKFLCFNGKPYYCWVDFNRFGEHKRNMYDMDWNLQTFNFGRYENKSGVAKPDNFDEMKKIVEVLCKDFKHVRVDLYNVDGKIYFGEMTFTGASGFSLILPEEYDYKLGQLWEGKE